MPKVSLVLLFLITLLCKLNTANAQNINTVLQLADELYEVGDYYGSIQFYKKAMEIDSSDATVLYKYARNLTAINSHEKSSRYYQKALIIDGGKEFPLVSYYLAESYRSIGDYRKSRRYFTRAIRPFNRDRKSYWYKRISQSKESASWAMKNDDQSGQKPANMNGMVNTNFSEYGGFISNNELYFSAMIADSLSRGNQILDKEYRSEIYVKSLYNDKNAIRIQLDAESKERIGSFNLANPSFFDNTIYFSVCDSNFICEIWKGELIENKLSKVKKLNDNINQSKSNNTQAHCSKIGEDKYLFFSSDRPSGYGGMDLWMAKEDASGFGEAVNLGETINSPGDEITPHYHSESQTLFFSSNWHFGFGGFDIFKSEGKPNQFKNPENLKLKINSSYDEYYFHPIEGMAIFSSNRREGNLDQSASCCNDLFEIPYPLEYSEENVETKEEVNVKILNKRLPLQLFFHNDVPDPKSRKKSTTKNYKNLAQNYLSLKTEYLTNLSTLKNEEELEEIKDFFEIEVKDGLNELEEFTPLLLKELEKGNKIELTIKGFASSVSKSDYNINLTHRRIESLINYFKEYENGAFIAYLNNSSENGGQLKINELPFGDYAVSKKFDENEKIQAVYSSVAAKQRRIELIAVSTSGKESEFNTEGKPKLQVNQQFNLGKLNKNELINQPLILRNSGEGNLVIYNVSNNCDCVDINYPQQIPAGEEKVMELIINPKKLEKNITIEILIVSNSIPNLMPINISFQLEN